MPIMVMCCFLTFVYMFNKCFDCNKKYGRLPENQLHIAADEMHYPICLKILSI